MSAAQSRERLIFSYPKLAERLQERPADIEKARKILLEISDDASIPTLKWFQKLLDFSLPKLYDGINFLPAKDMDFKKLVHDNCVVLVPNHQSHADYIALNYSIFKRYHFATYIAGGINLNIFPIGTLFRKSGCICYSSQ